MGYTVDSLKSLFDKNIRQVVLAINCQLGEIVCELNKVKSKDNSSKIVAGGNILITGSGSVGDPYIISTSGTSYISLSDLSSILPITYDSNTGIFSIEEASATKDGYITKEDWSKFNNSNDKNYVYIQSTPSSQWVITHNLDKYPSVSVIDSVGNAMEGQISWTSTNNLTISFTTPVSGKASLN